MKFKTVITKHWESEDGRFRIKEAYPSGFCAEATYSEWVEGWGYSKREFTDTLDEAMAWCMARP